MRHMLLVLLTGVLPFYTLVVVASSGPPKKHGGYQHWKSRNVYTDDNPMVEISDGLIQGVQVSLEGSTSAVNQFLGIPFAISPPRRFEPPTRPRKWLQALDATAWKPACIQQFTGSVASRAVYEFILNSAQPEESEDCLYLNVYAPASPPPPGGRSVMFWIFGGAFRFGTAGTAEYNGTSFAAYQDVIIVSANYRTNVFGFHGSTELPLTSRNPGFFDQRLALQWTYENIRSFGGNPDHITIFGESAGAFSVDRLITVPPKMVNGHVPFRAAITQSGQASVKFVATPPATDAWATLVQYTNCTQADSQLECLRAVSASSIRDIITSNSIVFNPTDDNVTQVANPSAARAAGQSAQVPLLTGTTAQDGTIFQLGVNNFSAYLETAFPNQTNLQQAILAAYPVGGLYATDFDAASQFLTEFVFQCPAAITANNTASLGTPTYRYFYNASFPDLTPRLDQFGLSSIRLGAYHSSEIGMVFGSFEQAYSNSTPVYTNTHTNTMTTKTTTTTAQQYTLSRYLQTAWAEFAKNPVRGPGWNPLGSYQDSQGDIAVLGGKDGQTSGATMIGQHPLDDRCALFTPVYATFTESST